MSKPFPMRKVRIQSDGTARGTLVFDAVSGERLDWIKNIDLNVNAQRVYCALTVLVQVVELSVDGDLDEVFLSPVAADAKLPPCETVEVDIDAGAGVEQPKRGSPTPWPFPSFTIGASK